MTTYRRTDPEPPASVTRLRVISGNEDHKPGTDLVRKSAHGWWWIWTDQDEIDTVEGWEWGVMWGEEDLVFEDITNPASSKIEVGTVSVPVYVKINDEFVPLGENREFTLYAEFPSETEIDTLPELEEEDASLYRLYGNPDTRYRWQVSPAGRVTFRDLEAFTHEPSFTSASQLATAVNDPDNGIQLLETSSYAFYAS